MVKLLILPKLNGWYYYQTHRGTKYHYHYAGIGYSVCGHLDFDERKNDKYIYTKPITKSWTCEVMLAPWRVCQHCNERIHTGTQKSKMYPKVSRCELE